MDKNQTSNKQNKNSNKIQEINYSKESKNLNSIKLESKIKESNLDFNLQKVSKIQSKTISKISISIITSILLSQSLVALPSGGKFTHGSKW